MKGKTMRATIDIDTGGTFTDIFVTVDGKMGMAKARTTPQRLADGIMEAVESAAENMGLTVEELLSNTELIRHATTVATNALIQRTGPKLGFITTEGFEDLIYIGQGAQWMDGKSNLETKRVGQAKKKARAAQRAEQVRRERKAKRPSGKPSKEAAKEKPA